MIRLAELPWSEAAAALSGRPFIALLPVGSVEAHGPHLPLATDTILAESMAQAAAARLEAASHVVMLLPSLHYGVTECARDFFGTLSISPATLKGLVADLAVALKRIGCGRLGIANCHLEPEHRRTLRAAAEAATAAGLPTCCPDLVRRIYAERLGDEFRSGACHAGSFEGSMILASRPELVREGARRALPPNPKSLADELAAGRKTFVEAGGLQAYFGQPSAADPAVGRSLIATLGELLAEELLAVASPAGG
ncbi:MAG: creatininase family protein [Planctomycetes bacterium]|nr:creatininase family protein [Planctomycetota bacterium]